MLVEMQNDAAAMENNMEGPQKIKNSPTIWFSNFISGYLSQRIEIRISMRD